MVEPVLTQEELEAIYSAMQADNSAQKQVDDYVLASEHAYNMRCMDEWKVIAKTISSVMETLFIRKLAVRGYVEIQDVHTIDDERDGADNAAMGRMVEVMPIAQTDPTSECKLISVGDQLMLLGIERDAAFRFIMRRTGIEIDPDEGGNDSARSLTALEERILQDFFAELVDVLQPVMAPFGKLSLVQGDPEDFWMERVPRGTWLNVRFVSERDPAVAVWLRGPAEMFGNEYSTRNDAYYRNLQKAKVEMVMELGRIRLKAFDIWNMKPGDVFPIGVALDEPLDVNIGGVYKLKGKPTVSRGHVAFEMLRREQ